MVFEMKRQNSIEGIPMVRQMISDGLNVIEKSEFSDLNNRDRWFWVRARGLLLNCSAGPVPRNRRPTPTLQRIWTLPKLARSICCRLFFYFSFFLWRAASGFGSVLQIRPFAYYAYFAVERISGLLIGVHLRTTNH